MSLHPAVKDVAVIAEVHYDDQGAGKPVVQAFVALKNPHDECKTLLEEIKIFTYGIYLQLYKFICISID